MARRGFTFLELLLILGLLLILWFSLLPAMQSAREGALSAACKSNLHQLALLCLDYAQSEGYFPWGMIDPALHADTYCVSDNQLIYPREQPSLHGVKSWQEYATFCWDFRRKAAGEIKTWQCGEMFGEINADLVLCCPKCRQARGDNWDGNRMTGYNYNVCFLGYVENDKGKRNYPTPFATVQHPDRVVVFGDGGYSGGPNKFMRAPFQDKTYDNSASSLRKAGTQAFRHGLGRSRHCNMAFLDGHVEEFSEPYKAGGSPGWVDEKTHTAFISPDNDIYGPASFEKND